MLSQDELRAMVGRDVYGSDGEKIGTVRQVYTDDRTDQPAWATLRTGLLGLKESFVPLSDAEISGGRLSVPHTKDHVNGAPNIDEDGQLTPDQEDELYAYYGRDDNARANDKAGNDEAANYKAAKYKAGRTGRGHFEAARTGRGSGPSSVAKQRRQSARARLRRYVVTDHVTAEPAVGDGRRERVDVEGGITRGYN